MKTVWFVDDDQEMAHAIRLMLRVLQYECTAYSNAREAARALLAGGRPDLMLLDINMPEVSGLDLLEFIRRRPEFAYLPVIMLSTEAADVTVDRALELGADGYVTKPVTIEELEAAIRDAFQRHQPQEART